MPAASGAPPWAAGTTLSPDTAPPQSDRESGQPSGGGHRVAWSLISQDAVGRRRTCPPPGTQCPHLKPGAWRWCCSGVSAGDRASRFSRELSEPRGRLCPEESPAQTAKSHPLPAAAQRQTRGQLTQGQEGPAHPSAPRAAQVAPPAVRSSAQPSATTPAAREAWSKGNSQNQSGVTMSTPQNK